MFINTDLLIAWGGVTKRYRKGDVIFHEGDTCKFYYQIVKGSVKMCNCNDDGKYFIQGIFRAENSFGEPPLFINKPYPSTAVAMEDCIILKLLKDSFLKIVSEDKDLMRQFTVEFAYRIYNKANTSKNIISQNPEHRIMAFLEAHKVRRGAEIQKQLVPFTRQEIADFTGLRVETVIRTTKKMYGSNILEIKNHKLYF